MLYILETTCVHHQRLLLGKIPWLYHLRGVGGVNEASLHGDKRSLYEIDTNDINEVCLFSDQYVYIMKIPPRT